MQLTRAEFESRYANGKLRIALVGMSNIGKSYTGMRLATAFDFELIEVDKIIWQQLGQGSMADFAAWQGQPYSAGYEVREAKSIQLETDATRKAVAYADGNAILDTTGSVIYASKEVLDSLERDWFIIHIAASKDAVDRLKIQYFKQPKPLIWKGHYHQFEGETQDEAILSSYPNLLAARAKAYSALAHKTISSDVILDTNLSIEDIFNRLKPTR